TDQGLKCRYLHSELDAFERVDILKCLRKGDFDVLVGVNLLREGLDLPEVSLVAVLDADKEGFLRSATSLIQTFGRAARNVSGRVLLYADTVTDSMRRAMAETDRRRAIQKEFNRRHDITPRSIRKNIDEVLSSVSERDYLDFTRVEEDKDIYLSPEKRKARVESLEKKMAAAVRRLEFEDAARLRDEIRRLKQREVEWGA
ncbi:MAG: UvrB/UvrC motif-containing protein, partial [Candidatus Aminicenantes bacterium]|nr:UvrB/UvrC motif-containing protein [Candidatus Aminicenantes bacterium]